MTRMRDRLAAAEAELARLRPIVAELEAAGWVLHCYKSGRRMEHDLRPHKIAENRIEREQELADHAAEAELRAYTESLEYRQAIADQQSDAAAAARQRDRELRAEHLRDAAEFKQAHPLARVPR